LPCPITRKTECQADPEFRPIVVKSVRDDEHRVIAELVEALGASP